MIPIEGRSICIDPDPGGISLTPPPALLVTIILIPTSLCFCTRLLIPPQGLLRSDSSQALHMLLSIHLYRGATHAAKYSRFCSFLPAVALRFLGFFLRLFRCDGGFFSQGSAGYGFCQAFGQGPPQPHPTPPHPLHLSLPFTPFRLPCSFSQAC